MDRPAARAFVRAPRLGAVLLAMHLAGGAAPRADAGDDAVAAFRRAVAAADRRAAELDDGFAAAFTCRGNAVRAARERAARGGPSDAGAVDAAERELAGLLAARVAVEAEPAAAAAALARSGSPAAAETLATALVAAAEFAARADAALLAAGTADALGDPKPAFQREALAARVEGLVAALGEAPAALDALLGPAAAAAAAGDKKASAARRTAVLDAVARVGDARALAALAAAAEEGPLALRVVATEGLAACRPPEAAVARLLERVADRSVLVRRAALAGLRALAPRDGAAVPRVLDVARAAAGAERAEAFATLRALTGQRHGDAVAAWDAFVARARPRFGAGFDAEAEPAEPAAPDAGPVPSAFGVPLRADGVVFVVDAAVARKEPGRGGGAPRDVAAARVSALRRGLDAGLSALGPAGRFDLVVQRDGARDRWDDFGDATTLAGAGPVAATDDRRAAALGLLAGAPWPSAGRAAGLLDGLWTAMVLAGLPPDAGPDLGDPRADTVVLITGGEARGGPGVVPDVVVGGFARANRTRRLVLHVVRAGDAGAAARAVVDGLARAGGGAVVALE